MFVDLLNMIQYNFCPDQSMQFTMLQTPVVMAVLAAMLKLHKDVFALWDLTNNMESDFSGT